MTPAGRRNAEAGTAYGEADTTAVLPPVPMTGTILHLDIEGGFYGLVADDGTRYLPLDLDEAFQQNGLRVRFEAEPAQVLTLQQWGRPVRLTRIEAL